MAFTPVSSYIFQGGEDITPFKINYALNHLAIPDGGSYGFGAGSVGSPSIFFKGDTTTGIYSPSAGNISLSISGNLIGLFNSSGLFVGSASYPVGSSSNIITSRAAGTPYTFTNVFSAITFGTTSPILTINAKGTWLILYLATGGDSGLTTTSSGQIVCRLFRTNNTSGSLGELIGRSWFPQFTLDSNWNGVVVGSAIYTTANTNDIITIQGGYSATTVSAGSLICQDAQVFAIRLY